MPYNLSIPGQVSEYQLKAIELVATLVPKNATIVETGSLYGRTSWAWAKSVDPSVTLYCVDPWVGNEGIRALEKQSGVEYSYQTFKSFVSDCPNLKPIQGFSPDCVRSWEKPIFLLYDDAVHKNPGLKKNLDFWSGFLDKNGIICGDDFRPRFPDVMNEATRFHASLGGDLFLVDFFWCVIPKALLETDKGREIAGKLRLLEQEAKAFEFADRKIRLEKTQLCYQLDFEYFALDTYLTLENESLEGKLLRFEVLLLDSKGDLLTKSITHKSLSFDLPSFFRLNFPVGMQESISDYSVVINVFDDGKLFQSISISGFLNVDKLHLPPKEKDIYKSPWAVAFLYVLLFNRNLESWDVAQRHLGASDDLFELFERLLLSEEGKKKFVPKIKLLLEGLEQ